MIYAWSLHQHEIIDMYFLREGVTVMESAVDDKKGDCLLAIGSEKGNLFIRQNWEEPRRLKLCSAKITDLSFSNDSTRLLVSTYLNSTDVSLYLLKVEHARLTVLKKFPFTLTLISLE